MNILEKKMVDILKDLRDNYGSIGVKAEFESEGTRLEEALRLKEVSMRAGLDLTIKIGGCEAVRDLYECRVIGVNRIVAPMVESVTAMKKFVAAAQMAIPDDEMDDIALAINIETITACNCFDEMLRCDQIHALNGIVIGRTDMTRSLNMSTDSINADIIFNHVNVVVEKARQENLVCGCGGGVSAHSIPFFNSLPNKLDYFETRKVIFKFPGKLPCEFESGILKAVGFELLWLKNKMNYYKMISEEDSTRILALESRYKHQITDAGGIIG